MSKKVRYIYDVFLCILLSIVSTTSAHQLGFIVPLTASDVVVEGISQLNLFRNLVPTFLYLAGTFCMGESCTLYLGYNGDDPVFQSSVDFLRINEALSFFLPTFIIVWIEMKDYPHLSWSSFSMLSNAAVSGGAEILCLMSDVQSITNEDVSEWLPYSIRSLQANAIMPSFGVVLLYNNVSSITDSDIPIATCFHARHTTISRRGFDILPSDEMISFSYSIMASWFIDVYSPFDSIFIFPQNKILNISNIKTNDVLEDYVDSVHYWRRAIAIWLASTASDTEKFTWNPAWFAYGPRDVYFQTYCSQTPGYIC